MSTSNSCFATTKLAAAAAAAAAVAASWLLHGGIHRVLYHIHPTHCCLSLTDVFYYCSNQ